MFFSTTQKKIQNCTYIKFLVEPPFKTHTIGLFIFVKAHFLGVISRSPIELLL